MTHEFLLFRAGPDFPVLNGERAAATLVSWSAQASLPLTLTITSDKDQLTKEQTEKRRLFEETIPRRLSDYSKEKI